MFFLRYSKKKLLKKLNICVELSYVKSIKTNYEILKNIYQNKLSTKVV